MVFVFMTCSNDGSGQHAILDRQDLRGRARRNLSRRSLSGAVPNGPWQGFLPSPLGRGCPPLGRAGEGSLVGSRRRGSLQLKNSKTISRSKRPLARVPSFSLGERVVRLVGPGEGSVGGSRRRGVYNPRNQKPRPLTAGKKTSRDEKSDMALWWSR